MPPTGILGWVKSHLPGEQEVVILPPPISSKVATILLIFYTFFYIAPFYISSTTRPSPNLSRDAPSVIRGRIAAVTVTCIICSITTFVLLSSVDQGSPIAALHSMGWIPIGFTSAARCVALTAIIFLGPLFEAAVVEGAWKSWIRLEGASELFGSWLGYRNIVAGPITEEVLFRSATIPVFILARTSPTNITIITPLIFGLAHIHHFYEFRLTHPHTPATAALARSLFQFGYTTLFGAYATFLYIRTGSLLAVVLVHAFCNWMGLPRFWGRVGIVATEPIIGGGEGRKRDDRDAREAGGQGTRNDRLSVAWTIAYYGLLVTGAFLFYRQLWPLTESDAALATF